MTEPPGGAQFRVGLTLSSRQTEAALEARRAEELGFDVVATGEHLFFHVPVTNAFIALAAAAGATQRVRLLSSLTLLPLYPPALAVKMATTLDQVSNGRFDLGVGVGGEVPREFAAAGVDVHQRGARTDEALELMETLWSGKAVRHEGRFADVRGLALDPGPIQPGGPPRWLGGRSPAAMNRAGRFANVWMPYMYTPEQLAASLVEVRNAAERHDRDPASVHGALFVWGAVDEDGSRSRAWAIEGVSETYRQDFSGLADRYLLHGTAEGVSRRLLTYRDAGAETIVFSPVGDGCRRQEIVDLFARDVMPVVRTGELS